MATANIAPISDVTADWQLPELTDHYLEIDEGTTSPDDSTYIQSSTNTDNIVDRFALDIAPADLDELTEVTINIRAELAKDSGVNGAKLELNLYHSTSTLVTGSPKEITEADLGGWQVVATVARTWSGLTLTKAQADTLEIEIKKVNV